tara:strand:- start:198 stop:419 length:222 start_codon:yes stop_codon:yes gene_type:complete
MRSGMVVALRIIPKMLFIWALDTKTTRINRYKVMAELGARLQKYMEQVPLLLGVGLLLANERKYQTKVDKLIH